ncbi:YfhD family protein [Lysinibacillus boronitolerans]|nr:YfhD family protein [Lysinibacillus boronitolerans]
MGRDNKQGQSNNKGSLPQTPKNQKIAPNKVSEEFSQEFMELINTVTQNKNKQKKIRGGFSWIFSVHKKLSPHL